MSSPLRALGRPALLALAEAFAAGRIGTPVTTAALAAHVPPHHLIAVTEALAQMERDGTTGRHLACTLRLLVEERDASQRMADRVQLVWSPAELDTVDARDTSVVVQELFRQAKLSVLICTYALDEKAKATALFGELAARMDADPRLSVRVFANVKRPWHDAGPAEMLVREFARHMRDEVWPGKRLPQVYYDQRSLEPEAHKRACLHAKAVVVDGQRMLLTSANFTEAAHERNIEAGILVDDRCLAERFTQQFDRFIETKVVTHLRFF
jgi:phosphatidylserine/phosphatidylglycerophosphate/cardiolipin synthase-like enzyme